MADKRADQLKEITERLEQGVKDIFTSEMYTKYLLTMSKFHNYSFNNTLLIAMQRPDATLVAGYNAWKNKFNRYVKKGEKGIQIIAPAPVKEREEREKIDKDTGLTVLNESGEPEIEVVERVIPRFRVTTVFDYAQTDGEPLPTLEVNELTARVKDYKKVPGWDNPYIQNHVVALVAEALKVQDVAVAYEINDGYFHIQTSEDGCDYTLYNKDFTVMDGGIIEVDGYRPVQEVMEEVLAEHGHSVSECGVISAEYLQEQSYRAETQRAEAMKEKLAAEKPAPEASISFYVAECAEFPVMGEFHDNLTLEQALEVYDKIPAERMNGIKSIGFSLEDGSIYSGMFDLMVGGEVQAEVVNHIQHYRESPLVQKAISDMKTLLEKRQASKELEERPNIRQSVREALKNRKKAQEQQPNQEQVKPKKAKKKGEMEL